jgi:hypothetical protein
MKSQWVPQGVKPYWNESGGEKFDFNRADDCIHKINDYWGNFNVYLL